MTAPLFSVLTPVYKPPLAELQAAIASVREQTFTDWEFVLVDDGSDADVLEVLRAAARADHRIVVHEREQNGGIVASSQQALDAARGRFVALLDHDDLLTPDALEQMAAAIAAHPDVDYLYSDEDKVTADGTTFYDRFHKPEWSPERLRGQMYTGHLSVLRTAVVRAVGGFRTGYEGSQDHDLVLRVTERARRIVHLPAVLYHWRAGLLSTASAQDTKPYAWLAGRAAVEDHVRRTGIDAEVELGPHAGYYRLRRRLDPTTLVSLVIPTRGGRGIVWGRERVFVVEAVASALAMTDHEAVEIVVVYDLSTPADVLEELTRRFADRLVLVPYARPFNFSEKCNVGVLASHGDVVVLFNDDVEVRDHGWLEALVAPLADPTVGMTGSKLFYEDHSLQHVGLQNLHDGPIHTMLHEPEGAYGPFGAAIVDREVTGVTGACCALRREVYDRVGGLCELLPVNFNDVDLGLKVLAAGLRILALATSTLYHFESRTRIAAVETWEHLLLIDRWGRPDDDPYLPAASIPRPVAP